jgi:ERCC4-type nuclease
MSDNAVLDRETYRKIKKMSREEMHNFLMRYADGLLADDDNKTIDLPALENELRQIKGIGEKRLEEIMTVIEKYLDI